MVYVPLEMSLKRTLKLADYLFEGNSHYRYRLRQLKLVTDLNKVNHSNFCAEINNMRVDE